MLFCPVRLACACVHPPAPPPPPPCPPEFSAAFSEAVLGSLSITVMGALPYSKLPTAHAVQDMVVGPVGGDCTVVFSNPGWDLIPSAMEEGHLNN